MQNVKKCFRQRLAGLYLESYNIMKSEHNLAMQWHSTKSEHHTKMCETKGCSPLPC